MAHIRQSRPDSGVGFREKDLKTFQVVAFWLGSDRRDDADLDGITQRKAQGPSRTCNESKEEEKKTSTGRATVGTSAAVSPTSAMHCSQ